MDEKNTVVPTETPTIDYKAEYEKMLAERDSLQLEVKKQKDLKDKYASENADYKKRAEAQMSEEEKKAREWQEMIEGNEKMKAQIKQMQLEKELLANGFTAEESDKLMKGNFAVKDIAEIIKARVELATKSTNAEFTKNSTTSSLMGNGTAGSQGISDYQAYQASKKPTNNIVEL